MRGSDTAHSGPCWCPRRSTFLRRSLGSPNHRFEPLFEVVQRDEDGVVQTVRLLIILLFEHPGQFTVEVDGLADALIRDGEQRPRLFGIDRRELLVIVHQFLRLVVYAECRGRQRIAERLGRLVEVRPKWAMQDRAPAWRLQGQSVRAWAGAWRPERSNVPSHARPASTALTAPVLAFPGLYSH